MVRFLIMAKSELIKAAIAFRDWEKPWTFASAVLKQLADDSEGRALFGQLWMEACRSDNWQKTDISECCDTCDSWLNHRFSWLPEEARARFVRAAAYQWK